MVAVRLTLRVTGPVQPAVAWERYERPGLWPTWSPQLRAVTLGPSRDAPEVGTSDGTRLSPGLSGRVHGPAGVWAAFTVEDVDAGARRWTWVVRRGPLRMRLEHDVRSAPSTGSATTAAPGADLGAAPRGTTGTSTGLTLHGPASLVLAYAPLARYALHRLVTLPAR